MRMRRGGLAGKRGGEPRYIALRVRVREVGNVGLRMRMRRGGPAFDRGGELFGDGGVHRLRGRVRLEVVRLDAEGQQHAAHTADDLLP